MKFYFDFLKDKGNTAHYIDATSEASDIRKLIPMLAKKGTGEIHYLDPTDYWLEQRITKGCESQGLKTLFPMAFLQFRHRAPQFQW